MKSLNYVIVEIDELYNNTDNGIIVNDSIENVQNINRTATVISAPEFTILKQGDEVLVHHNIFRKKYDVKGKQINSNFWIEDNKYFVPLNEIFMYKRDEWKAISPYCFVSPVKAEQEFVGFDIKKNVYKGNVKQKGIVEFSNPDLESIGVTKGTEVYFSQDSEYEFNIGGQLCYKMNTLDILATIE